MAWTPPSCLLFWSPPWCCSPGPGCRWTWSRCFGGMVLAIRRHSGLRLDDLENGRLRAGELLLVEVPRERVEGLSQDHNFVLVTALAVPEFRRSRRLRPCGGTAQPPVRDPRGVAEPRVLAPETEATR